MSSSKSHSFVTKCVPYDTDNQRLDPSDVVITRRFGEGTLPLFKHRGDSPAREASKSTTRHSHSLKCDSSANSSSPERYRRRTHVTSSQSSFRQRPPSPPPLPPSPPSKKRQPDSSQEKVPYYLDEQRERDRLRRVYGATEPKRHRSSSRSLQSSATAGLSVERFRHGPQVEPPHPKYAHQRSISIERRERSYRRPSSRSLSRERDHLRALARYRYEIEEGERNARYRRESHMALPPAPQIITIPVPVSDYSYALSSWPPHHEYLSPGRRHGPPLPPPRRFAPYRQPMYPPPYRGPFGMPSGPYAPGIFRPIRRHYAPPIYRRTFPQPRDY